MTEIPCSERKVRNCVIDPIASDSKPDWLDQRFNSGEGTKWGDKWGDKWGEKAVLMRVASCIRRVSAAKGGHWEVIS